MSSPGMDIIARSEVHELVRVIEDLVVVMANKGVITYDEIKEIRGSMGGVRFNALNGAMQALDGFPRDGCNAGEACCKAQ